VPTTLAHAADPKAVAGRVLDAEVGRAYLLEFLQGEENPIEIKELCLTIIANLCNGCKKNKKK